MQQFNCDYSKFCFPSLYLCNSLTVIIQNFVFLAYIYATVTVIIQNFVFLAYIYATV